jgi:hypothetical protein
LQPVDRSSKGMVSRQGILTHAMNP